MSLNFKNETLNFSNINKKRGQIKFTIKINEKKEDDCNYQMLSDILKNENSENEYNIKLNLNNNNEINFSVILSKEKISNNIFMGLCRPKKK